VYRKGSRRAAPTGITCYEIDVDSSPTRGVRGLLATLRGATVLVYAAVSMPAFFLLQLPVMAVTRSGEFSIWLARRAWGPAGLRLAGVRLEVTHLAPIPGGPAIYTSNHESILDIWALFMAIPRNLRVVAKSELFRIPIFGWYLRLAKFVPVDRANLSRAVASLKAAGEIVRSGVSLVAFPEGTRSTDGRVRPFKKGPFVLAVEAGVPVVPVAIAGAAARVRKGRVEVTPGTIRIAIGAPVLPSDFPDREALLAEVHRRVLDQHRTLGGAGAAAEASASVADRSTG
jgi:1-acyl-sn-glycerol-3-phosphate acyltransferase